MKTNICILTKSLKDHDYCVAGVEFPSGRWIRLVTSKDGGAFPKEMLDDKKFKELDLVEVELLQAVPYKTQVENWLIDLNNEIKRIGKLTLRDVLSVHPIQKSESIFNSFGDYLEKSEIKNVNHSLEIINVKDLVFDTSMKGDGRHHYKVNFQYNGHEYKLALTDPQYRQEEFDQIRVPSATLVVSIPSVPYGENDLYYKFVAKIFI